MTSPPQSPPQSPPRPGEPPSAPPPTPAPAAAGEVSRPTRVLAVTFGLVLFVATVAYVCLALVALLARRDAVENRRVDGVIRAVSVRGNNLPITVTGAAGSGTATVSSKVEWSWGSQPRLSVTLEPNGTLAVSLNCSSAAPLGCGGHLRLVVPAAVPVSASTSDGSVTAAHLRGALRLHTSDGRVTVDDVSGSLDLDSSDGGVRATGVRSSRVSAATSDGVVHLSFVSTPDDVVATSSDGGVRVLLPPRSGPYAVDVSSSDGGAHNQVRTDSESPRHIYAHTSDGAASVGYQGG